MKKLLVCTVLLISFFFMNSTNLMAVSPLQVSANGRFIVKTDNSPFFPQNDWATSLPWKLNTTNAASYLAARKAQGFNIVSMQAVKNCDSMADYIATTNVAGIAPFQLVVDGDYKNRWDVTKPIEAYWSAIDSIIDIAATQGLYISLVPLPTSGLLLGTYRVMPRGDDSTAYAFGNWIGARYADKTNIIWLAGAGSCSSEWLNVTSQVNALAKGITDGVNGTSNNVGVTDYSTTLMTYEPQRWTHSSSYWFHNEEWLDFNSIDEVPQRDDKPQCNQVTEITGDYNKTPLKPTWLFGPVSEGSHDFGPWQCRFQVYQTLFAGGFGASYGNRNVQSFNSGWDTNINTESAMQMQYVTALMTSSASNYTFLARIPDQNLIVGDTGEITQPGDWYQRVSTIIQATRTEDGKYAMIYSANGRDITVSMSKLDNGTMSAKWYNPRIGGLTTISGSISSGLGTDNVTFDPPGETSDPGNDWVLVLDLVAGPAPIDPIINITNQDANVTYDVTEYTIGGTNNENVVGTMIWSNQLTVAGGSFAAAPSWTIPNIALNVGANVIKVTGENSIGNKGNDSIILTRGGPGTGTPVLDITTADATVQYNTTKYNIDFTINTNVVGQAHWINTSSGDNGYVNALIGIINDITLNVGLNVITVAGTNVYGQKSTDSVTITRSASLATPFIDITTGNKNVSFETAQLDVVGTNVNIVGTMNWENQLTGISGTITAANNWTIPNVALNTGNNIITVSGTNVYGDIARASVTISRLHEPKITLRVSDNKRFLVNKEGAPFFPQNDWATSLPWKLNTADATAYLAARKAQGFNIVSMQAVKNCDSMADYIATTNVAGIAPFQLIVDGDYKNRWDVTKPIEAYWSVIDSIIDIAAVQGLYISLVPLPTSELLLGTYRVMPRGDDATAYAFGNWIGARYADKTNIIWLAGTGRPQNDYFNVTSQVNALAKGIADGVNGTSNNVEVTDYSTTLMTYESQRWTHSSSYWFHNEEWLDFNSIDEVPQREDKPQYNQVTEITDDYNQTPVKPTWLFGPVSEASHDFGPWQCRFQVYQTLFAGGFGASYGNRNVQSFNSGWDTNINTESALQMQYVTDLMTSVSNNQFLTRIPDQSLIDGDTGEITQPGDWYQRVSTIIQATRTENRNNAMIYSANGRNISVNMDQLAIAGALMTAEWYNPRTGDYTFIDDVLSGPGAPVFEFDPPGDEAEGNDWVLVLNGVPEPLLFINCYLLFFIYYLKRK